MKLHQTIKQEITAALRAKDSLRLDTLRSLNAAFMNDMIANPASVEKDAAGAEFLSDAAALTLVKRSVKQHKDSIEQFEKGGRSDLAEKEKAELAILETFMPTMMSRDEIRTFAKAKVADLEKSGAFNPSDRSAAGKLTGTIMKGLAGRADGADVKAVIDEILAQAQQ